MHIQVWSQYFWPESVGAGIWLHQLAVDLVRKGHQVTFVTALPNYPEGRVFPNYRGRLVMRESVDGVQVIRTYIRAAPRDGGFWSRAMSFGSFCASSIAGGLLGRRPTVIYSVLPPLPLGWSAELVGKLKGVPVVVNIQDIYPDIAVSLGYLQNSAAIRFFQWMESSIYHRAAAITVIGDGFRENLIEKGVPAEKIFVIPNWADSSTIQPSPKKNSFRQRWNTSDHFLVVYSGGMGHNTTLDILIDAAAIVSEEPFQFVLVGDGSNREALERRAQELYLKNVLFLPFQPIDEYPDVLAASDIQVVSLNQQATEMSLPSKVLKIMSSGKPVLALARPESDLARMVRKAGCGISVNPDDRVGLVRALRQIARTPADAEAMGGRGRRYLLEHFDRQICVGKIEAVLKETVSAAAGGKAALPVAGDSRQKLDL